MGDKGFSSFDYLALPIYTVTMKNICIYLLIIGQALALTAWASAPVVNEQGTETAHMHLDVHEHKLLLNQVDAHSQEHEHEHDEGCHLHLSAELNNQASDVHSSVHKSPQNTYLPLHIGRSLSPPLTPPPTS